MTIYQFFGCYPLLAGIIIGLYFYKFLRPKWLRIFTWFLLFTLFVQIFSIFYVNHFHKSNHFIFNIYIFIQFSFYFYIFYQSFDKKNIKFSLFLMDLAFILYFLYNIILGPGFFIFSSASNTLGSICIIFCCLNYFYSLFQSELNLNFFRIPMFWISTGFLFYFVGNFIYLSLLNYIVKENFDPSGNINFYVSNTLSLFLYGLISFGFLSNQPWKKEN